MKMKKKMFVVMLLAACVGLSQAALVSWDGSSTDISGLTGNIQLTPGAADTVWSTSALLIDSPGTQADFKAALSQVGMTHKTAQINAGLDQIYVGGGGKTTDGKTDAVSGLSQIVAFDTAAFGAADLLSLSVDISQRYGGETMAFRWFAEAGGNAYVSGVVNSAVGTATVNHTLADATIEWFNFDATLNIEDAIGASAGTLTLSDVAYAGVYTTETWTSGTTNWRGVKIAQFSATSVPEPATMALLGLGGLLLRRRKR
ncbi:MAG: PEP-CTERM sorting domain-containing protein [Planctomycetota bacterium]|jgi:hypothetical protein